jgi:inorganic pyrophosphatase
MKVYIEIEQGSNQKYEYDHKTKSLVLDLFQIPLQKMGMS